MYRSIFSTALQCVYRVFMCELNRESLEAALHFCMYNWGGTGNAPFQLEGYTTSGSLRRF